MNSGGKEALAQLEEITRIIESTNQLFFPGKRLIIYGIAILLIPLIELPTKYLTFGNTVFSFFYLGVALAHVLFYFAYFSIIKLIATRTFEKVNRGNAHPLLQRALAIHKTIVTIIALVVIVLTPLGYAALVAPLVYVLLGILFDVYGRFAGRVVRLFAWSYIILGFIFAILIQSHDIVRLWIVFNTYLGTSFIVMGSLHKNYHVHV